MSTEVRIITAPNGYIVQSPRDPSQGPSLNFVDAVFNSFDDLVEYLRRELHAETNGIREWNAPQEQEVNFPRTT